MSGYLGRLLGPGYPELTCEECFAELDWYVDYVLAGVGARFQACSACRHPGECLGTRDCLGMRSHLEGCPACAEDYSSLLELLRSEA